MIGELERATDPEEIAAALSAFGVGTAAIAGHAGGHSADE